ncbi:MAG: phospholipid carrier-dependent glycosyltransferase, partial [Clostridia bacterium]|nr:phospholipid carrier-dependent glycosyltransferase [Deltaproteobacteria bacterium]
LGAILIVGLASAFTYLFALKLALLRTSEAACKHANATEQNRALKHARATALVALVFLFSAPHVFYHAHLACFDGPIMALIIVSTYAFWRSTESRRWIVPACILWGIALATKHNAVFTLAGFGATAAIVRRRRPPLSLLLMPALGLFVFYILYPYGWRHPLERISAYYNYHAHHEHYPVDFFGTLYVMPPFPIGYAFRMTALTVPLVTLVLGAVGLVRVAMTSRTKNEPLRWGCVLLVIGALVPPLVISLPSVPIFGGTKHWMPMMPFFCIAAAITLTDIAAKIAQPTLRYALPTLALLLPIFDTVRTHPNGQTYFNELVFGHQGGAYFGLPRTFWGGDGRAMLASLNAKADKDAKVFTHRMNLGDWQQYREDALVRRDLIYVNTLAEADWGLMYHQREHQDVEYAYWQRGGVLVDTLMYDGVPVVSLYRLKVAEP